MSELLARNHEHNLYNINKINHYNKLLLFSLVICVVFQGIILFIMIIKMTHRISGPIYVMSVYMREIIEGRMPEPRNLREKDEFKDFYELFREMIEAIKKRHH